MTTKIFKLNEIVNVLSGNNFDLQDMTYEKPEINFVSRTKLNNGVCRIVDFIQGMKPFQSGLITISLGGNIGEAFYQNKPFYTSQNVVVLSLDKSISIYAKLYLCQVIKFEAKERFRVFGRELNKHIKCDFSVRLPTKENGSVDWLAMEKYIRSLCIESIFWEKNIEELLES